MKKTLLITLVMVTCCCLVASGQSRKKKQTRTAVPASAIVGHTYQKKDVKICDDELAESFDNGMFKLVLDLTVTFLSESVMEVSVDGDMQSRVYSKEQLREVMGGFDSYFDTDQYNYTVKNGVIYIPTQKYPFAVINKGGQSITIKDYVPFDGNVLQRIE